MLRQAIQPHKSPNDNVVSSAAAKGSLAEHERVVRREDLARDATGSGTAADRARVRQAIRGGRRSAPGGPAATAVAWPSRAFCDLTSPGRQRQLHQQLAPSFLKQLSRSVCGARFVSVGGRSHEAQDRGHLGHGGAARRGRARFRRSPMRVEGPAATPVVRDTSHHHHQIEDAGTSAPHRCKRHVYRPRGVVRVGLRHSSTLRRPIGGSDAGQCDQPWSPANVIILRPPTKPNPLVACDCRGGGDLE
jgi:hypothetical protein